MRRQKKKVDIYGGLSPVDLPAYSIRDASHYLRIPTATLRSWAVGRSYPTGSGPKKFHPLIHLAQQPRESRLLSFTNLVEAHVLAAVRRFHRIPLPKVRRALHYVSREFSMKHPFAHMDFETDGLDLFISEYGRLINASSNGQVAIRELIQAHLQRIERDEQGVAARLFPFTRTGRSLEQPRLIVIDPRISFGRPVLVDTGIPTEVLVSRFLAGDTPEELSEDYSCERLAIDEAIRCELEKAA